MLIIYNNEKQLLSLEKLLENAYKINMKGRTLTLPDTKYFWTNGALTQFFEQNIVVSSFFF